MKIGCIRVSTEEQNPARQQTLLHELGADKISIDKASGKNTDRPELHRMLDYVRRSYTVSKYHGKCKREKVQACFIAGRTYIMVVTNVFGLGTDKPDVCLVIHAGLPPSLDSYVQEIERQDAMATRRSACCSARKATSHGMNVSYAIRTTRKWSHAGRSICIRFASW